MGGSAWAMTRDIAEGHVLVTERVLRRLSGPQVEQLRFELERKLRELRGQPLDLADHKALLERNRRIQRLNGAVQVARNMGRRRGGG